MSQLSVGLQKLSGFKTQIVDKAKDAVDAAKGNFKDAITKTRADLVDQAANSDLANEAKRAQIRKYTPTIVFAVVLILVAAFMLSRRRK